MTRTLVERLQTIDRAALTLPVRRALGSEMAEIVDWQYQQIHGGVGDYDTDSPGIAGIARFTGNSLDQGKQRPWSLIFKALPMLRASPDRYRGTRELHAYRSGFLNNLPGDITTPRFLGSLEEPGEASCLWLEEITDEADRPWPLSRFGLVARQLGQLNGVYLAGQILPDEPWFSRSWLRWSVGRRADVMAELASVLDDPLMRRYFPGDAAERTFRLWAERETLLDAVEHLPQTFCHLDIFPRNLFARHAPNGRTQMVAVDWAFAGIAALGEEIGPLIWGSLAFGEVDSTKASELEALVFDSYVDGLRDAGWQGSPQVARLGYALTAPLRYGFPRAAKVLVDKNNHAWIEQTFGRSMGEFIDSLGNLQRGLLRLADEARETLKSLG